MKVKKERKKKDRKKTPVMG